MITMYQALIASLFILFLSSCSGDQEQQPAETDSVQQEKPLVANKKGCQACHSMTLDQAHDFDCVLCHNGDADSGDKDEAHKELIFLPSHPDNMNKTCGKCHPKQVENTSHSLHFTLKNEVNLVRSAFGAENNLNSLTDIPVTEIPKTSLELVDDLLRRRCLRCHPYTSGDKYPAVARGTGCASCHLEFYKGRLVTHSFLKTPGDTQCLQCHYGNWVGYDYYGRYEHDMNDEYRTPYTTRNEYFRPFGVEFHQLNPDIHQQKGLICVDCHGGKELMAQQGEIIRCSDCHDKDTITRNKTENGASIEREGSTYFLLSKGDGKKHKIPIMKHPAHSEYNDRVNCQVCHAQWAFGDTETHLLRKDVDEYDDFARLTVQGSFEVEKILKNNLDFDAEEISNSMTDKITGEAKTGLWYKGYITRRWENIVIGRDTSGRLQVMRPVLDLHLSWVDEDENVRFDSVQILDGSQKFTPYIPHTTGKAGLFYRERIMKFSQPADSKTQ
ncbi:MAG TPA: hypothetical protein EYP35_01110 [Desulfobacterales bacterium]|nr:hypothetical protein [Desulfobacterales bacterium]